MKLRSVLALGLSGAVSVGSALAAFPRVIYSTIQSSPTSDVPGIAGLKFDNDSTGFERPYISQNGQYWALEVQFNTATSNDDEAIMVGSGNAGAITVREGDQAPWAASGETVGPIRAKLQVNNSGQYAFGQNLGGSAPTTRDEQIVAWNGANFVVAAVEGAGVPTVPGEALGATLTGASISNAGDVGYHASSTVGALPTAQDDFLILRDGVVAQSGIAGTPSGQLFSETWNLFNSDDFQLSGDGTKWLAAGTLTGATTSNVVVVVNNQVVLQESVVYPGLTAGVATVSEHILSNAGDWFVRGETAGDAENFVMRNGTVIAKSGDAVPGGLPGETWNDATFDSLFFIMAGNDNGDYLVGGVTDNADLGRNAVVVFNNSEVILRENDPVDLNGDGLLNDGVYISVFNNEDMVLTNDLWVYFTATLVDDTGASVGQAFMSLQIPEPATLSLLALAGLLGLRRR